MRNHRMFNVRFITNDRFMTLPPRVQLLYFQLIAIADDEGFVGNLRMVCTRKMYIDQLIAAGLVHVFDTGPALILHWFCHNAVKASHAKETMYIAEKALVTLDEQKIYVLNTQKTNSGILPSKEKKSEEKKIKEKESEEKESKEKEIKEKISKVHDHDNEDDAADAAASGGSLYISSDKEKNFSVFWDAYPKKTNMEYARQTFMGLQEDFNEIMDGLEYNKKSNQWVSDHGFFIPDAHNWLKRKGWKDRPALYKPKTNPLPTGAQASSGHLGAEELAIIRRALNDP